YGRENESLVRSDLPRSSGCVVSSKPVCLRSLRSMTKFIARVLSLCCFLTVATAQPFPLWERLLAHYGGKTDETPVPSMKMGNHMQMSLKGQPRPGDERRAQQIMAAAHNALVRYADVNVALREGYKPFHPTGRLGEEVHYTNYRFARKEQQQVNY